MTKRKNAEKPEPEKRQRTAEELKSLLFDAVRRGDFEEFKKIVNECAVENGEREKLLNCYDDRDCTLLHTAAELNQVPIINWLLSNKEGEGRSLGFNKVVARATEKQQTALHLAVENRHVEAFLAVVNGCRVDNGERKELINAVDTRNDSVLDLAIRNDQAPILSWLFSAEGGGLELPENETSWDIAGKADDLECFLAIVNSWGVDNGERRKMLNAVDYEGRTLLHIAVEDDRDEIASWILSNEGGQAAGFDRVFSRTAHSETVLHLAAEKGNLECFLSVVNNPRLDNGERQELINAVDNNGLTVLHSAAEGGSEDIIRWILSEKGGRGAGFDRVLARSTDDLSTALHCAVQYRHNSNPTGALLSHCTSEERMSLFLAVDEDGWTALHHAARSYSEEEVIDELLSFSECALIVNRKDNRGMTALHRAIIGGLDKESQREWALFRFKPDKEIVKSLLGLNSSSSKNVFLSSSSKATTTSTAKAWIDPNIGIGLL